MNHWIYRGPNSFSPCHFWSWTSMNGLPPWPDVPRSQLMAEGPNKKRRRPRGEPRKLRKESAMRVGFPRKMGLQQGIPWNDRPNRKWESECPTVALLENQCFIISSMENPHFHLLWISASVDLVWLQPTQNDHPWWLKPSQQVWCSNQQPSLTITPNGLGSPTRFPLSEEALAMTNAAARRMSMFSSELTILSNGPVECHWNQLDMDHEAVNGPTNGVCLWWEMLRIMNEVGNICKHRRKIRRIDWIFNY